MSVHRSPSARIRAVGVVVPARDEVARIGDCLRALGDALDSVSTEVTCAVCVIADRCRDDTEAVARSVLARWRRCDGMVVANRADLSIGALRALGVRHLLRGLHAQSRRLTWLLSTDADSAVPRNWVTEHLHRADAGADVVAGSVVLDEPGQLHPDTLRRYTEIVDAGTAGHKHSHAYAANLGVRADAYTAVGGFPDVSSGEEHVLLDRLRSAGYSVVTSTRPSVRTSARVRGRSGAGLAELLSQLHEESTDRPAPKPT